MHDKEIIIKVRGIILHDEKLLVVEHAHSNFMALPGGHLEFGEDAITCLKRELIEELGIEPKIGKLLYINTFIDNKDKKQYVEFFFEIENGESYLDIEKLNRTHAHELAEIVWISRSDNINILPEALSKDFKENNIDKEKIKFINQLV
jgi:ADP-ribose pyrophosphatase YjhB (NUDIX family)